MPANGNGLRAEVMGTWIAFGFLAAMVLGSTVVSSRVLQSELQTIESVIMQRLEVQPADVLQRVAELEAQLDVNDRLGRLEERVEALESISGSDQIAP